jgi:hypothetical protein
MNEGVGCKGGKHIFLWSNIKLDTKKDGFRV